MVVQMKTKPHTIIKQENMKINDIITKKDLDRWEKGDIVLIDAPTGRGKSYFIMNGLYNYCKANGKKILLLTNRTLLKGQFRTELDKEIESKSDIIKVMNYQEIEAGIIKHEENKLDMSKFHYVIADECHYFFTDALFNDKTDLVIEYLENYHKSVVILLSATCALTKEYFQSKDRLKDENIYSIKANYEYIDNLYFYTSEKAVEKLLLELPEGEKVIYIAGVGKAYEMSLKIPNAKFICSQWNKDYKRYIDKETYNCIKDNEMFNCKALCGTTVLDNGINIKDRAVRHIIIDVLDLDIMKQIAGRKRIDGINDTINLYIKTKNGNNLNGAIHANKQDLELVEILKNKGQEYYRSFIAHRKEKCKAIYTTRSGEDFYKINEIVCCKLKWDNSNYKNMLKESTTKDKSLGFRIAVCNLFGKNILHTKFLDDKLDEVILEDYLNKLVGEKMFKEQLGEFKNFINSNVLKVVKGSHGSVGIKTINSYFEELGLDYIIKSGREKNKQNRDKTYWIIGKKVFSV